jgi:hypothetical protein
MAEKTNAFTQSGEDMSTKFYWMVPKNKNKNKKSFISYVKGSSKTKFLQSQYHLIQLTNNVGRYSRVARDIANKLILNVRPILSQF